MAVFDLSTGNFLAIQQNEAGEPDNVNLVVSQPLTISHLSRCSIQFASGNDILNIEQSATTVKDLSLTAISYLQLLQVMGPSKDLIAANALLISQNAANVNLQIANNVLAITQSATASFEYSNTLTITQTVAPNLALGRTNSQTLTLGSFVAVFKTDAVNVYSITVPDPIHPTPIILTFGSESITLKIPEIGDSDKIEVDRVQAQTRGGDLIIFRDPEWPITEILKYKITNMIRHQADELLNFFQDSIGSLITLVDYQGVSWQGVILTPDAEVTCTSDFNCGSYDIEFEFQGTKI